jgi:hypothetical protein
MGMSRTEDGRSVVVKELSEFWRRWGDIILQYGMIPDKSNGVGGTTFRAYGKFCVRGKKAAKPGTVFREWVSIRSSQLDIEHSTDFAVLHKKALTSLVRHWKEKTGRDLTPYPYGAKLIDLHFKHIVWHPTGRVSLRCRKKLLKELHQPIDKYSLRVLRRCGINRVNDQEIPSNASMGIVCEADYAYFQQTIASICIQAKVPPFAFDQYAWNRRANAD